MPINRVMDSGLSGTIAAKTAIATAGHNISNATTEGFSRQRVETESIEAHNYKANRSSLGGGVKINRIARVNDEYIEKQVRNAQRDLSHFEEKDMALRQVEDIFNEMNGDGLNRLVSRFFNEFRKLSQEPESLAVRQSVREVSQGVIHDFHRIRKEVEEIRRHLDSRVEGYVRELNSYAKSLADMNKRIHQAELLSETPNDLFDKRDELLKKINSILEVSTSKDRAGLMNVDIRGAGPLITGGEALPIEVEASTASEDGKPEGSYDLRSPGAFPGKITHLIQGGKLGALVEVRDKTLTAVIDRLDEMAYTLADSVNSVHRQGVTLEGESNVDFFNFMSSSSRAAEFITLSDDVANNVNSIATALDFNSPGDNRVAIAISKLQNEKLMNDGVGTMDDWYNSIISDVGVVSSRNRFNLNQQKDIVTQLGKVRERISGVSIDEETANLLQFQHVFDASARVIQVADELLKIVLSLKRD